MGQSKSKRKRVAVETMCGRYKPADFFMKNVLEEVAETLDLLDMEPSYAKRLFVQFVDMNKDASGEISMEEFHDYFKVKRNVLTERVFSYIDLDLSGELDYNEYLVGTYNFCTFDHFLMAKFMFDVFDVDKSGDLTWPEIDALVRMLNGEDNDIDTDKILREADTDGDGVVTLDEFSELTKARTEILAPAFELQSAYVSKTPGGKEYWRKKTEERIEKHGTRTVEEILLRRRKAAADELLRAKEQEIEDEKKRLVAESNAERVARLQKKRAKEDKLNQESAEKRMEREAKTDYQVAKREYKRGQEEAAEREAQVAAAEKALRAELGDPDADLPYDAEKEGSRRQHLETLARLKDKLQRKANLYFDAKRARVEADAVASYATAASKQDTLAKAFFDTKEGKNYIKVMGKEHALRMFETRFGILSKKQLAEGENKARLDYVQKKTKEALKEAYQEYEDTVHDMEIDFREIAEKFEILFTAELDGAKWQWQEIWDPESRTCTYWSPAINGLIYSEPFVVNAFGKCQDTICDQLATVRCGTCRMEYCADCSLIAHSTGNKRYHTGITYIPEVELEWRKQMKWAKLSEEHVKKFIEHVCVDPLEIARRGLYENWPMNVERW